jgi:nicotinamidase-related amidase
VEAIEQYRFNRQHVYVCGVNTCACVYATVSGLAKRLPASLVYVLPDACRCTCGCDVRYQVTALRHRHDNVCLAPEKRGITDEYHRPRYEPVR